MYTSKSYTLRLITPMLGTVPKDPEIYKNFIESKKPEEIQEPEYTSVESVEQRGWTGFHSDERGLFIYDYMIRGFLKNAGNILKKEVGMKNLRSKIDNQLFIFPRKIHLGVPVAGVLERPIRVLTMQGPRVCLIRSDYVDEGLEITFTAKWLTSGDISEKLIDSLLSYGELCGLGQFRNGSYGRFEVVSK